jgi:hypothetical protein
MNRRMLVVILATGVVWSSIADPVYTFNFNSAFPNGGVIPDGNVAGWSDTRIISGVVGTNVDVNVWLELSGGYNGDLYGYLVHDTGFAVLLNRVGRATGSPFGYSDAGMDIKFDDSAGNGDIHYYQLVEDYGTSLFNGSSWSPDGRNVNPATINGTEPRPSTSLLADFVGLTADGSWTLFLADLSVGEETTVMSWGIEIKAVPEPSTWALLGLGLLGVAGFRRYRHRRI